MGRPKITEDRIATALRLPVTLHARLKACAAERTVGVNVIIVRAIEDYLGRLGSLEDALGSPEHAAAGGGAERAAGKVPVPSAPSPAVPHAPCSHPKAQRQTLGYATRCGACGEIVK